MATPTNNSRNDKENWNNKKGNRVDKAEKQSEGAVRMGNSKTRKTKKRRRKGKDKEKIKKREGY